MSGAIGAAVGRAPAAAPAPGTGDKNEAALRKVADQMAGVFAEQLFKAMRDTVPQGDGAFDGGSGEEMFSGLMDQHLAAETPTQWARGLTDSIVRHLRGAIAAQEGGATGATRAGSDAAGTPTPEAPRALNAPAPALDPLRPAAQLRALQQSPQLQPLQPLPDASR